MLNKLFIEKLSCIAATVFLLWLAVHSTNTVFNILSHSKITARNNSGFYQGVDRNHHENHVDGIIVANRSSLKKLSEMVGLSMEDERLVDLVSLFIVPPADPNEPYVLKDHRCIRNSQHGQDELVEKILKKKKNGFFFEAGALNGERFSNSLYFERHLGWTGVLVEPIPSSFKELKQKKRKAFSLNTCLSPNTSATEILLGFTSERAMARSLDVQGKFPNYIRQICVPVFTILQALGNPIVDYMSIDTEGTELTILRTIPWSRVHVRLLGIEVKFVPEGPEAVITYMEKQGFKFYKFHGIDYIFYNPRLSFDMDLSFVNTKELYTK